jgi:hypothetical protein
MTLAEYRKLKGLTMQQVADQLRLSKSRVSEIENRGIQSIVLALCNEDWSDGAIRPIDLAPKQWRRQCP